MCDCTQNTLLIEGNKLSEHIIHKKLYTEDGNTWQSISKLGKLGVDSKSSVH